MRPQSTYRILSRHEFRHRHLPSVLEPGRQFLVSAPGPSTLKKSPMTPISPPQVPSRTDRALFRPQLFRPFPHWSSSRSRSTQGHLRRKASRLGQAFYETRYRISYSHTKLVLGLILRLFTFRGRRLGMVLDHSQLAFRDLF